MTHHDLDDFLFEVSSDNVRAKLRVMVGRDDVLGLGLYQKDGKQAAIALTEAPPADNAYDHLYLKPIERPKSRTMQALDIVSQGQSAYAAAAQLGISESAVWRALKRRQGKTVCPCCKQIIRDQTQSQVSS